MKDIIIAIVIGLKLTLMFFTAKTKKSIERKQLKKEAADEILKGLDDGDIHSITRGFDKLRRLR